MEDLNEFTGNHNLTGVNAPPFTAGKYNDAVTLNGIDQYVYADDHADWDFVGAGDIFFAGWVNHDATGVLEIPISQSETSNKWWRVRKEISNTLSFQVYDSGFVININGGTIGATWYHWAVTKVGNAYNLFVNGSSVANTTYSGTKTFAATLNMGYFNSASPSHVDGQEDEYGWWKGMTFADQAEANTLVTALYNTGTGAFRV